MSVATADGIGRDRRRRPASRQRGALRRRWGRARPSVLVALPIICLAVALILIALAIRAEMANATIRALRTNRDREVSTLAPAAVLLARIDFLLGHDRVDEVQPFVEALDASYDERLKDIAHYDFANGRLRQAFDRITAGKLEEAGPLVMLARQEYRRALTSEPSDWDAKFNLDVASRLIRDFPSFERTIGDEVRTDRKKIWTDVPGKPEGLP